jgi:hypothetical protein
VSSEQQKPVERLVERILSAMQRDVGLRQEASSSQAGADVSALARRAEAVAQAEAELDELASALYGLTPAERDLVKESAKK